jgi:hypothetical protein
MTTVSLDTTTAEKFSLPKSFSWRDSHINCTLAVAQPSTDPELWSEFVAGAHRSYRMRGVEDALDVDTMRTGSDTCMFFVVLDDAGRMLAGLRAKGPLRSADDSHAVIEWAGQPSQQAVRDMITDRLPFGVLEMKSGWVAEDADRDLDLTTPLSRSPFHMMALIDVQFCMATAASYVLNRWRSSGGAVAGIPATPYPDERYQTKMIWWNRQDFVRHAEPAQVAKTLIETRQLIREFYGQRDSGLLSS